MRKKEWKPEELLPKADLLAHLIEECSEVSGVALTGSLARREPASHDIDLIVFHDGGLQEGDCRDPSRADDSDSISLVATFGETMARRLSYVRGDVSVNYVVVHEKALWDCQHLQALRVKERFPEFYLTVFCQTPLVLLAINSKRSGLRQFIDELEPMMLSAGKGKKYNLPGIVIRHHCGDPCCRPSLTWEERRIEIVAKKEQAWRTASAIARESACS